MRTLGSKSIGGSRGGGWGWGQIEGPQEPGKKDKMVHSTYCWKIGICIKKVRTNVGIGSVLAVDIFFY